MQKLLLWLGMAWAASSFADQYSMAWHQVAGGGGTSTNGTYTLRGTIGQPEAATPLTSGSYLLQGGFWTPYTAGVSNSPLFLTWSTPAPIQYGTPLGPAQLDATASVPGSFSYAPPSGMVLNAGTNTLSVVFTPADTSTYGSATGSVALVVLPAPLSIVASNASRLLGTTNPLLTGTILGLLNGDNITATFVSSAGLYSPVGSYPITPVPVDLANRLGNYALSLTNGTLTVLAVVTNPVLTYYTVTDLGSLGGNYPSSDATAINARGEVVGESFGRAGSRACLFENGTVTDLGTLGGTNADAIGINDSGQIVGEAMTTVVKSDAYTHFNGTNQQYCAFLYSQGHMTNLGTLPAPFDFQSQATGINNHGVVVGNSGADSIYSASHGFVFANGPLTDLVSATDTVVYIYGINDSGQMATWLYNPTNSGAYIYSAGQWTSLGTLAAPFNVVTTPSAINSGGDVAGYCSGHNFALHAFLYAGAQMSDLGSLPPPYDDYSEANGINSQRQVVGESAGHAFLYADGRLNDLNSLIEPDSGWTLSTANAINDSGQIAGSGSNAAGQYHAILLTPLSGPTLKSALQAAGTLQVSLFGVSPGRPVVLQGSTNLHDWFPVSTNLPSGSTTSFTNAINPTLPREFFRTLAQ